MGREKEDIYNRENVKGFQRTERPEKGKRESGGATLGKSELSDPRGRRPTAGEGKAKRPN